MSGVELREATLDEPVLVTIWRDLKVILIKLYHVGLPTGQGVKALRDWDLWGPFFLCFVLAIILSTTAPKDSTPLVFSSVFVIVWVGSIAVTLNAKLLGGNCSFFQGVCVLGYCIFPLVLVALVMVFIRGALGKSVISFAIQLVLTTCGFIWSTFSSLGFMAELVPPSRKYLAIYPMFLFYLILGWIVLIQ